MGKKMVNIIKTKQKEQLNYKILRFFVTKWLIYIKDLAQNKNLGYYQRITQDDMWKKI